MSDPSNDDAPDVVEQNPFAPSLIPREEVDLKQLPPIFWVQVLVAFVVLVGFSFLMPGFGIPAVVCLVAAAIRVPLLQRNLLRKRSIAGAGEDRPIPGHSLLLLTSWVMMLAIGFAAVVAFVLICFPAGLLALSVDASENFVWIMLGLSGLVGLAAFVFLFRFSLRLPF